MSRSQVDQSPPQGAQAVLDAVSATLDQPSVSVRDILEGMGQASFTPVLLIPAFTVLSPLSGVPGLSSICGMIIALISLQMLLGRDHLWLPEWLLRRKIGSGQARKGLKWLRRPAGWLDRATRQRLEFLVSSPGNILPVLVCVVSGGMMPFLELVPFTSSILGSVVVLITIGFQVRDGLFTLLGTAVFAAVVGGIILLLF